MREVYADHAATTPIHPDAAQVVLEVSMDYFGNPSSIHQFGRQARKQLDESREKLAATIGAAGDEIVLTSGGTESDNLAIIGYAEAHRDKGSHIITTTIEHHAVLHTCQLLEEKGFNVTYLPVNDEGFLSPEALEAAITDDTILVTIMHGNNEVGSIQPLRELARIAENHGIAFHVDAVQTYGLIPIDVKEIPVTMLSVSSHKINGPNGIGFLYVRRGTNLASLLRGGEQERKRRPGTESVAAAAGFAKAAELAAVEQEEKFAAYQQLKDHFLASLRREGVHFIRNGSEADSLPHIVNLCFPGTQVESFLVQLDLAGIAAASGSACTAGSVEPSHVLEAMYSDHNRSLSSVRFSFGKGNTLGDTEYIAAEIKKITDKTVMRKEGRENNGTKK
ncbi:cysteine desulfurase family protein [Bacillus piscicola]|uniref:cysteine desulfurase family protein n=1 Tax=Bacillus piscicola TaxID=1632684 RepID=UPI001F08A1A4|nr:cysteine desulfurase family protein [Bacillus piscicola]